MPQPDLTVEDFAEQAAAILEASRRRRGQGLYMEADDIDTSADDDDEGDDQADDDPDGDVDGDGQDDDEGDDAPAVKEDGKPVTAKDWAAVNEALKNARKAERAAKRASRGKNGDDQAAKDQAAKDAEARYKPIIVRQAARGALAEAGLILPKGKESAALAKAFKLLDLDEIDLTDDGDVDGLDDQIDELKATFPELFARRGTRRVDGSDRGTPPGRKTSSADALAGLLTGD